MNAYTFHSGIKCEQSGAGVNASWCQLAFKLNYCTLLYWKQELRDCLETFFFMWKCSICGLLLVLWCECLHLLLWYAFNMYLLVLSVFYFTWTIAIKKSHSVLNQNSRPCSFSCNCCFILKSKWAFQTYKLSSMWNDCSNIRLDFAFSGISWGESFSERCTAAIAFPFFHSFII